MRYYKSEARLGDELESVAETARELADTLELNIMITSVREAEDGSLAVFYISDTAAPDWYDYIELAYYLGKRYKRKFILRHIRGFNREYLTFDTYFASVRA